MRKACLAGVKTRIDGIENPNCWESKPEGRESKPDGLLGVKTRNHGQKGACTRPPFFLV